jgi:hypothetical protein
VESRVYEGADTLDSRDIIERIEELREAREAATDESPFDEDDAEELGKLEKLQEQAEGYCPDWTYGAALISDSYFEEYAEELADDIGAIDRNAGWPLSCIDWAQAALELQQDYTSVEYGSTTYWVR